MCGLAGLASTHGDVRPELLLEMREALRHRGPDGEGLWVSPDRRVGLAHRRLSIIDTSDSGQQPMTYGPGGPRLVFNGEIYNYLELKAELAAKGHRFRTQTDTEVILAAYREWGEGCLSRLAGMFAFAIHDEERNRLFLARDRAGEKPLFYRVAGGRLAFSSELKGLLVDTSITRKLDLEAADHFFAYGYVPGELCVLRGFRKLPPGHWMSFDLERGSTTVRRYWDLPEGPPLSERPPEELAAELKGLLMDAVRRQLRADVPVGILLSGGLDSSLVAAMAVRCASIRVKTFTIRFPAHPRFDEGPYARLVANHLGTEHTELVAEPASLELLPRLARQYDEPISDSSMIPTYLVSRLVREQAKVALGGDGGDELFGGYRHYSLLLRQNRYRAAIPGFARRLLGGLFGRLVPLGVRGRNYLLGIAGSARESVASVGLFYDREARLKLVPALRSKPGGLEAPEAAKLRRAGFGLEPVSGAMRSDFHGYLPEDILVKVDRASMLASLEVRAPWLDHRIVEFAFSAVPTSSRVRHEDRKILPRMLARELLPPALDLRRKQGFSLPLGEWFKGSWGSYVSELLRDVDPDVYDRRVVGRMLAGQEAGWVHAERLFGLALFELWRREYRVQVG